MNSVQMFFCNTIENTESLNNTERTNNFSRLCGFIGNSCFYPIRLISSNSSQINIKAVQIGNQTVPVNVIANTPCERSGVIGTIIAVVFLLPATIIGTAFKTFAYIFSAHLRENHRIAVKYSDPSMRAVIVVGSEQERVSEDGLHEVIPKIPEALQLSTKDFSKDSFYKNYKHIGLVINAESDSVLLSDPGFSSELKNNNQGILKKCISKLILVGARLLTRDEEIGGQGNIPNALRESFLDAWQCEKDVYWVKSFPVKSVAKALADPLGQDKNHDKMTQRKVYVVNDI